MEEDKLLIKLERVREELEKLKKNQTENNLIPSFFFSIPLGLAIFMYFTNMLNEALNVKAIEWVAWFGIIAGILLMFFPSIYSKYIK